jgi:phosphoglycerol transferase MdoB-like AlkP superfamily enzyme
MKIKKLNLFLYKFIGVLIICLYLYFLTNSYFGVPLYGDSPLKIIFITICGIYFILPYIVDKIFVSISLFLITVYYLLQSLYFVMFEDYIYLTSAFSLYNEAKDYSNEAVNLFTGKEITLIIILVFTIVILCLLKREKFERKLLTVLASFLVVVTCSFATYMIVVEEISVVESTNLDPFLYNESDRYIYDKIPSKMDFVNKFGLEMFFYRDMKDHYFIDRDKIEEDKDYVTEFMKDNLSYEENEYTGLFEGKHLYLIEAESLTTCAIDEILTPTLYKMMNEGYDFVNYNSPLMVGSTSDAETMVNTSLISLSNGEVVGQAYATNTFTTTIANLFVGSGYTTRAMHNNYEIYYNRNNYFPALGYPEFFDSYDLGVETLSSDLMCQQIMNWVTVAEDKSFVFDVTYSGHQPYNSSSLYNTDIYTQQGSEEYDAYYQQVEALYPDLSDEIKFYIAKNMSLDKAIESLMYTYEVCGRTDDLVIAMYGDHFVKGMSEDLRNEADQYFDKKDCLKDTPFIVYNSTITPTVVEKYTCNIDIMPTLLNLFNISYDKKTILGNDIFDERYHGFSFTPSWTIKTDDFEYAISTNSFARCYIDEEDALKQVERFLAYQDVSNIIFLDDYFKVEEK